MSKFKCVRASEREREGSEGRANSWRFQACLHFLGCHVLQFKHSHAKLITQSTPGFSLFPPKMFQTLVKTIIKRMLRQRCLKCHLLQTGLSQRWRFIFSVRLQESKYCFVKLDWTLTHTTQMEEILLESCLVGKENKGNEHKELHCELLQFLEWK